MLPLSTIDNDDDYENFNQEFDQQNIDQSQIYNLQSLRYDSYSESIFENKHDPRLINMATAIGLSFCTALFIFLFSTLPYCMGDTIFDYTSSKNEIAVISLFGAIGFGLILYMSDLRHSTNVIVRWICYAVFFLCIIGCALFSTAYFGFSGPLSVFLVLIPMVFVRFAFLTTLKNCFLALGIAVYSIWAILDNTNLFLVLYSMYYLALSVVVYLLRRMLLDKNDLFVTIGLGMATSTFLGVWASISLGDTELSNLIVSFAFLLSFTMVGFVVVLSSDSAFHIHVHQNPWIHAIMTMTITPLALLYLFLSWIAHRFVRRGDTSSHFTRNGERLWHYLASWHWTQVIERIHLIGIFVFLFNVVVARFFTVFYSWLLDEFVFADWYYAMGLFTAASVGVLMIPGTSALPIYISAGILFRIPYALAISIVVTLGSLFLQHTLIGRTLGSRVMFRSQMKVNSKHIRAIKTVLSGRNMIHMSCVLCGGPEWFTFALAGVLKLNFLGILIFALPLVLLIVPGVYAGHFMTNSETTQYSRILLGVTVILKMGFLFAAVRAVSNQVPTDETDLQVLEYDSKKRHQREYEELVTKWKYLPKMNRILLSISAISMTVASALFVSNTCFVEFEIFDSVKDTLHNNVLNLLVNPNAYIALSLFIVATAYIIAFRLLVTFALGLIVDMSQPFDDDVVSYTNLGT